MAENANTWLYNDSNNMLLKKVKDTKYIQYRLPFCNYNCTRKVTRQTLCNFDHVKNLVNNLPQELPIQGFTIVFCVYLV